MGGGFSLPSFSDAWGAFKDDPMEWNRLQLDPGGLFGASSNEVFAGAQAMVDVGGIGAKPALAKRNEEKQFAELQAKQAKQAAEVAKQSADAQAAINERRKRMINNRKSGRSSLLSGSELGVQATQSTLG